MKRRDFLKRGSKALVTASMGPLLRTAAGAVPKTPVNVLFLTADDLNWTLPGYMGNKQGLTPQLDQLAARSFRFVNNRSVAPICQPSREAMMTGLLPHHSGALGFDPVNPGTPTMTTVLQAQGYYTACIQKTEHHRPHSCFPWDAEVRSTDRSPVKYAQDTSDAIAAAKKAGKPFFILCNCRDPHRPFYDRGMNGERLGAVMQPYEIAHTLNAADMIVPSTLEDLPEVRDEWAAYCNSAQRLDVTMGRVLRVLADSGEAANTVVVFTVDHGMPFPFAKATVYDNGSRTPALLHYPGMGKPRAITTQTRNIDLMPTLLDLMGVQHPPGLDGHSWLPIINSKKYGKDPVDREYAVTYINTVSSGASFPMRCIQSERFSMIFSPWADGKLRYRSSALQGTTFDAMMAAGRSDARIAARVKQCAYGIQLALYDLKADPDQRVDILDRPEHKAQAETMKGLLLADMEKTGDPQLDNFRLLLDGKQPIVVQPPRRKGGDRKKADGDAGDAGPDSGDSRTKGSKRAKKEQSQGTAVPQ